jgi:iron(III) transport system substrate-binding protein
VKTSRVLAVLTATATATLLTACGGAPTAAPEPGAGEQNAFAAEKTTSAGKLDAVFQQLSGLTGDARRTKLIELAKAGGEITWYTSLALDDAHEVAENFKTSTGLEVQVYSASSDIVIQRIQAEAASGRIRADAFRLNGVDLFTAQTNGYFADKLDTPVLAEMREGVVHDNWVEDQRYEYLPAWNTDLVSGSAVPKNYTDLLTNFRDGNLGFTIGDFDWLYGMVGLLQKEGHSEDEALKIIQDAARGGVPSSGHTLTATLLSAGEYKATATTYAYRVNRLKADGAPVAFTPALGPVLSTYAGVGISATAANPAGGLLLVEYGLTDNQAFYVDGDRTPTNKNFQGGADKIPGLDLVPIDYESLAKDSTKWSKLYDDMMKSSGRPVREG